MRLKNGQKLVTFDYDRDEGKALIAYYYNGAYKDPSFVKYVDIEEANKRYDDLVKEGYRNAV